MTLRGTLLVLVMTGTLLLSLVIGVAAADWPFWKRVISLPADAGEWPDSFYSPTATIDGGGGPWFDVATDETATLDHSALDAAATWAESHNSTALIVLHEGRIQLERYWQGLQADQRFSGRAMSRSLLGVAYGRAIADRVIPSLDVPVSDFLPEWRNDPRGRITLHHLLWNVSGLEEPPPVSLAVPGSIERFRELLGKNSRLALGSNFEATALSFDLAHEPGVHFALSNVDAQLAGIVLERATGMPYERYIEQNVWQPIGASVAEFYMDRANGMPAVYCCFRATARDFLRLGALLVNDGLVGKNRVLPEGWVSRMATGSLVQPGYGLQMWSGADDAYAAVDVLRMEGGGGRTIWVVPSRSLVIVRLGRASPGWDPHVLPNLLLRGMRNSVP